MSEGVTPVELLAVTRELLEVKAKIAQLRERVSEIEKKREEMIRSRNSQIGQMIARGQSYAEIGEEWGISHTTVMRIRRR